MKKKKAKNPVMFSSENLPLTDWIMEFVTRYGRNT